MTLSLCMIVKNEEAVIKRCLESVKGVFDEIIIVDTGSEDSTKKIAYQYTDKVYDYAWQYDFSAARNYSFSLATSDYIMWLDADDVLTEKNRNSLISLKNSMDGSVNTYFLIYDLNPDGQDNSQFYFYRERIFKRSMGFLWRGAVHEYVEIDSVSVRVPVAVTHIRGEKKETGRNLMLYIRYFLSGHKPSERDKYYFAKELYENGFIKAAIYTIEDFLNGNGWIEDKISACRILADCHKKLGDENKRLSALFKSFEYAPPRPVILCEIGDYFISKSNYNQAIFWFELAIRQKDSQKEGFVLPDYGEFIPYMWLCYCYDRLGMTEKAEFYNNLAGKLKPLDKNYLYNKNYFEKVLNKKEVSDDRK